MGSDSGMEDGTFGDRPRKHEIHPNVQRELDRRDASITELKDILQEYKGYLEFVKRFVKRFHFFNDGDVELQVPSLEGYLAYKEVYDGGVE